MIMIQIRKISYNIWQTPGNGIQFVGGFKKKGRQRDTHILASLQTMEKYVIIILDANEVTFKYRNILELSNKKGSTIKRIKPWTSRSNMENINWINEKNNGKLSPSRKIRDKIWMKK